MSKQDTYPAHDYARVIGRSRTAVPKALFDRSGTQVVAGGTLEWKSQGRHYSGVVQADFRYRDGLCVNEQAVSVILKESESVKFTAG